MPIKYSDGALLIWATVFGEADTTSPMPFFPLRYLTPIDSYAGSKKAHRADVVPRAMDVVYQGGLEAVPTLSILAPNKVQGDRRREDLCALAACTVNFRRQCED